jgi:hypothetical protein
MTVHTLLPGDRILVRAAVLEPFAEHALIGIPAARHQHNGQYRLHVAHTEIVVRDLAFAYEVLRLVRDQLRLVREGHQALGDAITVLDDRVLRHEAELYEAGCSPLFPLIKA